MLNLVAKCIHLFFSVMYFKIYVHPMEAGLTIKQNRSDVISKNFPKDREIFLTNKDYYETVITFLTKG